MNSTGHFKEKLRRPTQITEDQKKNIVSIFEQNPETILRAADKETDVSITSMLKILRTIKKFLTFSLCSKT